MSAGGLPLLSTCWPETATVEMSTVITAKINSADRNRIRICLIRVNPLNWLVLWKSCVRSKTAGRLTAASLAARDCLRDSRQQAARNARRCLDCERPDGGVVRQPVSKEFRCLVQPRVTLLLNHLRSVRDGLLH